MTYFMKNNMFSSSTQLNSAQLIFNTCQLNISTAFARAQRQPRNFGVSLTPYLYYLPFSLHDKIKFTIILTFKRGLQLNSYYKKNLGSDKSVYQRVTNATQSNKRVQTRHGTSSTFLTRKT